MARRLAEATSLPLSEEMGERRRVAMRRDWGAAVLGGQTSIFLLPPPGSSLFRDSGLQSPPSQLLISAPPTPGKSSQKLKTLPTGPRRCLFLKRFCGFHSEVGSSVDEPRRIPLSPLLRIISVTVSERHSGPPCRGESENLKQAWRLASSPWLSLVALSILRLRDADIVHCCRRMFENLCFFQPSQWHGISYKGGGLSTTHGEESCERECRPAVPAFPQPR
jgi:hypothetical protein